jgi:hypothetical protein
MNKHQIIDCISDAMNAIADNEPGSALLVLYSLQRNLRYDFEKPSMDGDNIGDFKRAMAQAGHPIQDKLPAMRPVNGKKLKSIDVPCTVCGAKPGRLCFQMTRRGPNADPIPDTEVTHFHRARVAKAKQKNAMNQLGEVVVGE